MWHLNNAQTVGIFDVNVTARPTLEKEVKQETIEESKQPKSTFVNYASDGKRAGGLPNAAVPSSLYLTRTCPRKNVDKS